MALVTTPFNYKKAKGRVFLMPSQTIPDESMSIKTIIQKYQGKSTPNIGLEPIYQDPDSESNGVNFKSLDLIDIQKLAEQAAEMRKRANEELQKFKEERARLIEQKQAELLRAKIRKEVEEEATLKQ